MECCVEVCEEGEEVWAGELRGLRRRVRSRNRSSSIAAQSRERCSLRHGTLLSSERMLHAVGKLWHCGDVLVLLLLAEIVEGIKGVVEVVGSHFWYTV